MLMLLLKLQVGFIGVIALCAMVIAMRKFFRKGRESVLEIPQRPAATGSVTMDDCGKQ